MKSLFRFLVSFAATVTMFSFVAVAQSSDPSKIKYDTKDDPIHLTKVATPNGDGTFTLRLESFVTGYQSNITTSSTSTLPLDIVLVLDMSGSMGDNISSTTYTALSSASYNYNGYSNNQYYYQHTDGQYYPVSKGTETGPEVYTAKRDNYYYDYNNITSYYYLYNGQYYPVNKERTGGTFSRRYSLYYQNPVSNNKVYIGTQNVSGSTTTIYSGTLYTKSNQTIYTLSYTVGGVKFYLSGTSVSTTENGNITADNTTIWTGVLYSRSTTTQTRLAALKDACKGFVDQISGNSDSKNPHTISIVTFASSGSSRTRITRSSEFATIKTTIEGLSASGGTYPAEAMDKAKTILDGANRQSAKLVVMFTDGVPAGSGSDAPNRDFRDQNKTEADKTIASSKALKSDNISYDPETKTNVGIQVYTVGVFGVDQISSDVDHYMDYTSSNYPTASSLTSAGTAISPKKYFKTASSADELNQIFGTIASSSTDTSNKGAGIATATNENNVTVRDIITPEFVIPTDASGNSKIVIKTAKSKSVTKADPFSPNNYSYVSVNAKGEDEYGWEKEVERTDLALETNTSSDGKTTVNVSGFDFSQNWVGYVENIENNVTKESKLHDGYKLIVEIVIEPDPEKEGGMVQTNDPASGLYIDGEKAPVQLKDYPSTGDQFVPLDMTIKKKGLAPNETAIFKIYQGSDASGEPLMRVAVVADASGEAKITVAKLAVGTLEDPIEYTVVEETNWTYRYTTDKPEGITQALIYKDENGKYQTNNQFVFGVEKTNWTESQYFDENSVNNVFKTVNSNKNK